MTKLFEIFTILTITVIIDGNVDTRKNNRNNVKIHHNYSKVNYQQQVDEITEKPKIYNAHSYYTNNQSKSEKLITYYRVINGTVVGETQRDPTATTIVIHRKKKQSPKIELFTKCPPGESGQFVYSLSCNQFLNCWKGRGYPQNCAPGTLFNPKTLECDFPDKVECVSGPRDVRESIRSENLKQAGCPPQFSGLIPDYFDCAKFINCANGVEHRMDCAPGTLFDMKRNLCDFPNNCQCFNSGQDQNQGSSSQVWTHNQHGTNHNQAWSQSTNQNQPWGQSTNQNQVWTHNNNQVQGTNQGQAANQNQGQWATHNQGSSSQTIEQGQSVDHSQGWSQSTNQNQHWAQGTNQNQGQGTNQNQAWGQNTNHGQAPNQNQGQWVTHNQESSSQTTNQGQSPNQGTNHNAAWSQSTNQNQGTNQNQQWGQSTNQNQIWTHANNQGQGTNQNQAWGQSTNQNQNWPQSTNQGQSTLNQGTNQGQWATHNQGSSSQSNPNQNLDWGQTANQNQGQWGSQGTNQNQASSSQNTNHGQTWTQSGNQGGGQSSTGTNHNQAWGQNTNQGQTWAQSGSQEGGQTWTGTNQNQAWTEGTNQNQDTSGEPKCPQGATGLRPHPYDCSKFLNCANGITYIQDCGPGTVYNPLTNVCDFPYNVKCSNSGSHQEIIETITPKYPQTVNSNNNNGHSSISSNDYDDVVGSGSNSQYVVVPATTTPRTNDNRPWPPPFPSTDTNADYVFEYEDDGDHEVTLEAENSINGIDHDHLSCGDAQNVFKCSEDRCIARTSVCDNVKNCQDGSDEIRCVENLGKFKWTQNAKLAVLEKERWDNVTMATCAYLCLETRKFRCRSFNYRKIDRTCFLTDTNIGLTGVLISYYPCDYYEVISEIIDCSDMYQCSNSKCIDRGRVCDGIDDCGDRQDEKNCNPEKFAYTMRLTGGEKTNEGLLEITAFGRTGYVCDDKFGIRDANVACRELGFELGAAEVKSNSYFAPKSPTTNQKPFYMMDDVTCEGNETSLIDCDFSGWGQHNCQGQEIVGVVCKTPLDKCPDDYWQCHTGQECLPLAFVCDGLLDCTDESDENPNHCDAPTQLRLINGSNHQEGRLEIRHNDVWGSICDDDFNEDAAKVACKQLGFKGSSIVRKDAYFGQGTGPIWLDQVSCFGNESQIEKCTHWDWGEHNCEHSEDVSIICSDVEQVEKHQNQQIDGDHSIVSTTQQSLSYNQSIKLLPDKCGYQKNRLFDTTNSHDQMIQARMIKANLAKKGDYPWQASIRVKGPTKAAHWCGAVIISQKYVLTAAHCLVGYSKGAYVIVAGDYDVDGDEGSEQEIYIDDFYLHPNFREGHKMNNDIAIIRLKNQGFRLTDDVQPICLPDDSDVKYDGGLNCTISGFGSVENGKSAYSHELRSGWIPIIPNDVCRMPHVYGTALTDGMFCAGFLEGGLDSCDGDSGGPLACLHNGVFTLYGMTSWGQHCGYANKPGVYVKVAHYRKWIQDTLEKYSTLELLL